MIRRRLTRVVTRGRQVLGSILERAAEGGRTRADPCAPPDTVFACVAEPTRKFLDQSARLVMSLRWFGGSMAGCRFVLGCTGHVPEEAATFFRRFGAELVEIERHDAAHGPSNKISLLGSPALAGHELVALLDCDTVILQDPSRYLRGTRGIAAKLADVATVPQAQLSRVFEALGVPLPAPRYRHEISGEPCGPYCNSGVVILREASRPAFAATWNAFNRRVLRLPPEVPFARYFTDQVSLALAIVASKLPFDPLPPEMNLPVHLEADRYPEPFGDLDPAIVHYHWLAHPDGLLKRGVLPQANFRMECFNARLRAERAAANGPAKRRPRGAQPKVVVGSGWWSDQEPHPWALRGTRVREVEFFDLWWRQVMRCLRPARILVTDSAAPNKPDARRYPDTEWLELDRNYGHANDIRLGTIRTKYSGFTRSVLHGAMYALGCDADWYVYVEQDCLLWGEDLLAQAVGDSQAEIFVGRPTEGGRGIDGKPAASMLQQSLIVVRRSGIERFIGGLLASPWTDGEVSPEEIMRRQLEPDLLRIPYGRSRPIDFGAAHFYAQHLTDEELERFASLAGLALPSDAFGFGDLAAPIRNDALRSP